MSRYLRRFIVSMVIYLTSIAGFTVTASACETRHFYNHSSKRFSVVFDLNMFNGGATCSIGNAINQRFCVVPPGGTAELHYPNFPVVGVPVIFIHSLDTPNPIYPGTHFDISANCAIEHGGSTGNIVVNDPANGDVQTCGKVGYPGGYDCR